MPSDYDYVLEISGFYSHGGEELLNVVSGTHLVVQGVELVEGELLLGHRCVLSSGRPASFMHVYTNFSVLPDAKVLASVLTGIFPLFSTQ